MTQHATNRLSISLFFLLQSAVLVICAYRIAVYGPFLGAVLPLAVASILLLGLFRAQAEWARNAGFVAGAGQIVLGLLAAGSGLLDLLRLNSVGLVSITMGCLLAGLGAWTISVMNTMSVAHDRSTRSPTLPSKEHS